MTDRPREVRLADLDPDTRRLVLALVAAGESQKRAMSIAPVMRAKADAWMEDIRARQRAYRRKRYWGGDPELAEVARMVHETRKEIRTHG